MVSTARIGDRTVTFRREPGQGPTIVCVHGSADNHHVYDRLLDGLQGRARMAINLPARADTDGPPLTDVAEMTAFTAALIDSEVEGEYVLAGHSLGGAIAIEHAIAHPERLRGIVLLATGARLRVHRMILQLFEQAQEKGEHPPAAPGLYEATTDPAWIEEDSTHRLLTPIATGAADWGAANGFDRMDDLDAIHVPALIVAGTNDLLTPPKYATYAAEAIRDSELHIIEGAGHMLVMERVAEVAAWMEGFAQRVGR